MTHNGKCNASDFFVLTTRGLLRGLRENKVPTSAACAVTEALVVELGATRAYPFSGISTRMQHDWFHQILGRRSKYSSSSFFPPSPAPNSFSERMNSMRSIHLTIL